MPNGHVNCSSFITIENKTSPNQAEKGTVPKKRVKQKNRIQNVRDQDMNSPDNILNLMMINNGSNPN